MAKLPSKIRPVISFYSHFISPKLFSTKPSKPSHNDPFINNHTTESESNPTNFSQTFHKLRTEGLINHAIKMLDGLSKDGFTHEALELFNVMREKGFMPDVVAHTAVLEVYVNGGEERWKDAIRVYERMLDCGVLPNRHTYMVLIKGLAKERRLTEAGKYLVEMVTCGMRPNCGTYMSVFEAYVEEEKLLEGKELFEELKKKGFALDEKTVRENTVKRGHVFKSLMSMLFDK